MGRRWKYVVQEGGAERLFDLAADPLETRDVLADHPELAAELGARVRSVAARRPAPETAGLADQDEELLEALGYVGDG